MLQMKVTVTAQRARQILQSIQHRTCQKGVKNHWRIGRNGQPTAQSICWLFCWATTGQGSDGARQEAQRAFDAIFNCSYNNWLNRHSRFKLDIARELRYRTGDIENEFRSYL